MERYKLTTWHQFPSFQRRHARALIEPIVEQDAFRIGSYGVSESDTKTIAGVDPDVLARIATGFPRYFNGTLFLFGERRQPTVMIDYLITEGVAVHVFFHKPVDEASALHLFAVLIGTESCRYGALDTHAEYERRHNVITDESDERVGERLTEGLPSLYRHTFIGHTIAGEVGVERIAALYAEHDRRAHGYLFSGKNDADRFPPGSHPFFDIADPFRQRVFPDALAEQADRLRAIERTEVPQYLGLGSVFDGEVIERALTVHGDALTLGAAASEYEIDRALVTFLAASDSDQEYRGRLAAAGHRLGEHWSRRYGLPLDERRRLVVEKNRRPWFINPFHACALMYEDQLPLDEFQAYVERSFKLKR